jgi:hypothetical protein
MVKRLKLLNLDKSLGSCTRKRVKAITADRPIRGRLLVVLRVI